MAASAQRGSKPILAGLLLVGAVVFGLGMNWGLPTRAVDPYLFGNHPVWTGKEIIALAPSSIDTQRGADVDMNPILDRLHPIVLNETDSQRAEIIRRYRLFTYQPDEMISLMALSRMHPGKLDFDPHLYQYGGLWIYPLGAVIKVTLHPKSDVAYYLDHPEEFGRMYIAARTICVAWGLVGILCVFRLAQHLSKNALTASAAALCFVFMPIVVNMSHEAKPHLPGAVLMLLSILAATRFVETGTRKWWVITGVACGCAFGMVLSAAAIFIVLPIMVLLRPMPAREKLIALAGSVAIALLVYATTNPFVPINYFFHRDALHSNLSNSTAMYSPGLSAAGILTAAKLILDGTGPILLIAGVLGGVWLVSKQLRNPTTDAEVGWLLTIPAIFVTIQFVLLARGKPAEYARFALFPDIVLAIAACVSVDAFFQKPAARRAALTTLVLATMPFGIAYVRAFIADSSAPTSRLAAAEDLSTMAGVVGLTAEPAPY